MTMRPLLAAMLLALALQQAHAQSGTDLKRGETLLVRHLRPIVSFTAQNAH